MSHDWLPEESIDRAIAVLNRACKADPDPLGRIMTTRYKCNCTMAPDPTIQVWSADDRGTPVHAYGGLGLLNGIFGINEHGWGPIAMVIEADGTFFFRKTTPKDWE